MRRVFSSMLLVGVFMSIFCILPATSQNAIIRVPSDYPTIQGAINGAHEGDTIEVASGFYQENLHINKTLTLIGNNQSTVLDGKGGTAIEANATTVSISGFKITNATTGILLNHCQLSFVTENSVNQCNTGIWLYGSDNSTVSDNTVVDCDLFGILLCGHSGEDLVTGNTLKDNGNGVGVSGPNSRIYHNNFINNQNQTAIIDSFPNAWDNTYEGNYWSDYNGTGFDNYGIGDSPYIIEQSVTLWNIDHYPLENPYILGDVNHDAVVDIVDISIIATAFQTQPGDNNWNSHADIDESGQIDIVDITITATRFGNVWIQP